MRTFRMALSGDFLNEKGQDAYGQLPLKLLDAAPHVQHHFILALAPQPGDTGYWERFYSLEATTDQLAGLDGFVVLRPHVRRETLAAVADTLTVIGRSGAGYDKVDAQACTEFDVALYNAPMVLDHSTASTSLMYMLALAKRLKSQERITRAGRWDLQPAELGDEIRGRTLGIVGFGPSGRELARLVTPFSMRLIAYSPHADPAQAADLNVTLVSLDELLAQSDFVSVHARPRPENHHLIGAKQFSLMKPTAYFINIARGVLVDQAALVAALREQQIAGAGLDVFEVEPVPVDDPLMQFENVIVTPHWSASTRDVWRATGRAMIDGMLRAARGEVPANVVNPEVLAKPGFQAKLSRFAENASPH